MSGVKIRDIQFFKAVSPLSRPIADSTHSIPEIGFIVTRIVTESGHKGEAYLLSTQAADGSWYVASRAPKFQPYFEGGFPYAHDQWISQWATGYASLALSYSLPETRAAK